MKIITKKNLLFSIYLIASFLANAQVKDKDGNTYKTVTIGSKIWMAENLNVSHFNNGDIIKQAKTTEEWENGYKANKPLWCYVNFDASTEKKYGKLYNFFAVNNIKKLAPTGWHVSSDEDWTTMINFLEEDKAVPKLKNTEGWKTSESGMNGTNETGFSAMPAGFMAYWGKFISTDRFANFWSSTVIENKNNGYSRSIDFSNYVRIQRHWDTSAGNGLSVRCVKD